MIHYATESGNPGSNNWSVLIHGLSCDLTDWDAVVKALPDNINSMVVDLRGHGHSVAMPGPYTMQQLGSDVVDLIKKQLPEAASITLVGHSMGTRVVLEVCNQMGDGISGVVFVDGSRQATPESGPVEDLLKEHFATEDAFKGFVTGMFVQMFDPKYGDAFGNAAIDRAVNVPKDTFNSLMVNLLEYDSSELPAALEKFNLAGNAKLTVLQSTTINENRERINLVEGQSVAYLDFVGELVPAARLQIVADTGHFIQLEKPLVVAEAIVACT